MSSTANSTPIRSAGPNRSSQEWRNETAFAALTAKGEIRAWGNPSSGGILSAEAKAATGVKQIFSTSSAFAALTDAGKVITWGGDGGDSSSVSDRLSGNIRKLSSTKEAFAAIDCKGAVTAWGTAKFGGDISDIADQLQVDVVDIYSTDGAFAALKKDGSVTVWGDEFSGGVRGKDGVNVATNVKEVRATSGAFAFIHDDDTVSTLGYWNNGGGADGQAAAALASGQVHDVFSSEFTFAALLKNGTVVTWGVGPSGGDSSGVANDLVGVTEIVGNRNSFAAIKKGGGVVSWGISGDNYVDIADQLSSGVVKVVASDQAFAAIKSDGSVQTWGSPQFGADSSAVVDQISSGVVDITASDGAFAARKVDGSVVTWGDLGGESQAVSQQLASGVVDVVATGSAFAALKDDGSIVAWGASERGGSTQYSSGSLTNIVAVSDVFTDASIGSNFSACKAQADATENSHDDALSGDDIVFSNQGKGKMIGGGGADQFVFLMPDYFGKKGADKIMDFNSREGDQLIFYSPTLPGIGDNGYLSMEAVKSKRQLKVMAKEEAEFVYFESKGRLYYNGNGEEKGFGNKESGGLIATFAGSPQLSIDDIGIY